MKVINKKTRKHVCHDCEVADSSFSRMSGLMFSIKKKNILFIFDMIGRHPIHAFFVFFPFHAVYLDWNMRVVDVQRVLPFVPFAMSRAPARFLLEICDGSPPEVGDVLCLDGKS